MTENVEPRPLPEPINDEGLERWKIQYQYRDGVVLDHILLSEFGALIARIERAERERDEARKAHCEAQHNAEQTADDERGTGYGPGPRTEREIAVEEYGQDDASRLFFPEVPT
jgi:hypothetical protein